MSFKNLAVGATAAAAVMVGGAVAAPLLVDVAGEHYNVDGPVLSVTAAEAFIAGGAGPDARWTVSTAIDYPAGAPDTAPDTTTLAEWLGDDAASLVGDGDALLETSVFRFAGVIDLAPGARAFGVGSDDGFVLRVGGVEVSRFETGRSFNVTTVTTDLGLSGLVPFEIVYFENVVVTGIEFFIDGELATVIPETVIPVPATAPLLLSGLVGLRLARRAKRG